MPYNETFSKPQKKTSAATDELTLRLVIPLLRILSGTLSYVEDSTSADTPIGLPQIVQSLLSYVVPDSRILLCPMRDYQNLGNYNYAILDLPSLYSHYTTNFFTASEKNQLFRSTSKKLFVVCFPAVEKDNILMHSVFGHEVGHQVAVKYLATEDTTAVTSKISDAIDQERGSNKVE